MVPKAKYGLLVFLFIISSVTVHSEVRAPYRGLLGVNIQRTPENDFESGFNLRMTNTVSTNSENINLQLSLVSVAAGLGQVNFPFEQNYASVPFSIYRISARTRSPLWPGSDGGILTLGNIYARYSPHTLNLERWETYLDRKGISLENMILFNSQCNAFLVWVNSMDRPLYGFKLEYKNAKYRLTGILTNYLQYTDANGWQSQELVKSIEWNYLLPNGNLQLLYASQERPGKFSDIKELVYKNNLNKNLGMTVTRRNYSPEYRPQFSDRATKYSESGAPQRWNPLDEFYGQDGIGLELEVKANTIKISLGMDHYTEQDYYRDLTMRPVEVKLDKVAAEGTIFGMYGKLKLQNKEKMMVNELGVKNTFTSSSLWSSLVKTMVFSPVVVTGKLNYWFDADTDLVDRAGKTIGTISERATQLIVTSRIRKGVFSGVTVVTGLKAISEHNEDTCFYQTVGFDYTTRGGIQLHARFTTPNYEEPMSYMTPSPPRSRYQVDQYDRFGQKVEFDNIFRVSYTLVF